jgi:hypothetical protein
MYVVAVSFDNAKLKQIKGSAKHPQKNTPFCPLEQKGVFLGILFVHYTKLYSSIYFSCFVVNTAVPFEEIPRYPNPFEALT